MEETRHDQAREAAGTSVVVPTYRRPAALEETLRALLAMEAGAGEPLEIIVVDDGGGQEMAADVVAALQSPGRRMAYVVSPGSGAAAARNHGARLASGRTLVFVDDDIVVRPDSLLRQQEALATFAPCAVNSRWEFSPELRRELLSTPFGRYRVEVEAWVKSRLERRLLTGAYFEMEGVTACHLALLRDDFWRVGGFDETFPFAGAEDQEFSIRARAAGVRLILDEAHEVWHNDRRLTFHDFCERQRRGAVSAVFLAAKHPASHAARPLIAENAPLHRADTVDVAFKKCVKRALSTRGVRRGIARVIPVLERTLPESRYLRRAYWSVLGLSIFAGVREGIARLDPPSRARLVAVRARSRR